MSQAVRSVHEPLVEQTNDLVIDYLSKSITNAQLQKELRNREESALEFESSHQLGYLSPIISQMFTESKFVVTIRDPKKWLKSRINFHNERKPTEWKKYRNFIWNRHKANYTTTNKY